MSLKDQFLTSLLNPNPERHYLGDSDFWLRFTFVVRFQLPINSGKEILGGRNPLVEAISPNPSSLVKFTISILTLNLSKHRSTWLNFPLGIDTKPLPSVQWHHMWDHRQILSKGYCNRTLCQLSPCLELIWLDMIRYKHNNGTIWYKYVP